MVKKIVITVLTIAVLIVLSVWGFMYYKRTQSFNIEVPINAVNAVRINVEQIGIDLLQSGGGRTAGPEKKKRKYGLDLPFNLFMFGLEDMPADCLFSRWKISNPNDFEAFLRNEFKPVNGAYVHNSRLFSCIYKGDAAVMMTTAKPDQQVLTAANAFLENNNTVRFAESKWTVLRTAKEDVTATGTWGSGQLYFKKGSIQANWTTTDTLKRKTVSAVPHNMALALHAGSNLVTDLSGLLKSRTDSIHWDRLQTAFDKGYALYIHDFVQQQESVVTYDFDDNFEKVATVSIQEKKVPGVYLYTKLAKPESITILQEQSVLFPPDSVSKNVFPLFGLHYTAGGQGELTVSSGVELPGNHNTENGTADKNVHLSLWCNIDQLRGLPVFSDAAAYLKPFRTLQLQGRKNGNTNTYELNLVFTDQDKYALKQVLDLF